MPSVVIAQAGDFFLYAPIYVAQDAGLFANRGLKTSITTTGGDDKTWAAVTSNSAQFGLADPTFVVASSKRGQPGKVVASVVNGVPFWGITFDSSIQSIKHASELRGRTVATFPSPSTAYVLQSKMFRDGGVEPAIREAAFGALIPTLRAGQANIALELEPNVSQAVLQGASIVYSMKDVYGDFAITGLTTLPSTITQSPTVVRGVVCGVQDALAYIRSNRADTLALLAKRFPDISPEVARTALDRVVGAGIIPVSAEVSQPSWDRAVAVRVGAGDFAEPGPFAEYVDNQFAAQACSR